MKIIIEGSPKEIAELSNEMKTLPDSQKIDVKKFAKDFHNCLHHCLSTNTFDKILNKKA